MKNFKELLAYTNLLFKENELVRNSKHNQDNFDALFNEIAFEDHDVMKASGEKNVVMACLMSIGFTKQDAYRIASKHQDFVLDYYAEQGI